MESRRKFLKTSAAALAVAAARPAYGFQGANDRVRMAVIGCGNRAGRVFDGFARQKEVQWVAGCEVNDARRAQFLTPARTTFNMAMVKDYRRILERNDVDAVLIGTPDFSHARIMIDAVAAGKDVYVEKPASNNIERLNGMLDAYTKGKQVVQVGTQQRSWDHFAEAKKIIDSGVLGPIRHVRIVQPGSYASAKVAPQAVPPGLDWNMWQLNGMPLGAPERPFAPNRLSFRAWYEYGSGLIGDWGAHHIDVAHWFMNADHKVPVKTAAVGSFMTRPDADLVEMVPDTFSIAWQYDNFVMSFANGEDARDPEDLEGWGVFFISGLGSLQVNRMGWALRPTVPKTRNKVGPPPPPTAGNVQIAEQPAAGRAGGPGGGRGGRGGGNAPAVPLEKKIYINPRGGVEEDYPLDAHVQNFLACMKSRQKPNADMEIGYYAAMPAILALESLKTGKILGWDTAGRKATAL